MLQNKYGYCLHTDKFCFVSSVSVLILDTGKVFTLYCIRWKK